MKKESITITEKILESLSQLSDSQYISLIEGRAKLVYEENIKMNKNIYETKEQLLSDLGRLKKRDLEQIANAFNIRLLKRDTKTMMMSKIIEYIVGNKLRKELFKRLKEFN